MSNKEGGPAYPGGEFPEHPNHPVGMSLREYFAGQDMAAKGPADILCGGA